MSNPHRLETPDPDDFTGKDKNQLAMTGMGEMLASLYEEMCRRGVYGGFTIECKIENGYIQRGAVITRTRERHHLS